MMWVILILTCLTLVMEPDPTWAVPVNVALGRTVTTQYTCGMFGSETYNTLQDAKLPLSQRQRKQCADLRTNGDGETTKQPTYPAKYMVDGNLDTWWQSTSRYRTFHYGTALSAEVSKELESVITVDLQQEFLTEEIIIQLGNALTPQKIAIMKSLDGKTYTPWIYGVSSLDDCLAFFQVTSDRLPSSLDGKICLYYEADDQAPGDKITMDLTGVTEALKEWRRIRYLKIKFYDMLFVFPFNQLTSTFNHFAVRELQVMAECPCNGQQEDCQLNAASGVYECVCGGNSKGRFCESCMDKYNQYQFQYGISCKECNCFGHSDSCFYSPTVEQNVGSIDINGDKLGGGVCLSCQHNTDGVNCERCISLYFRPKDRIQTTTNVCVPCGCSPDGSTTNPDTGLVDCVMNDDQVRTDGKLPGECFCKVNVQGTKCDVCKPGYTNLDGSHDGGCVACSCFTSGTVDASTLCLGDSTGQCPCKANVKGRACDECVEGFYGLTAEDVNGCKPCDCNVGGAVDQVCDRVTGQCVCRSDNIVGRTCDLVDAGFFYPSPHAIYEEIEDGFGEINVKSDNQYSGFSGHGYVAGSPQTFLNVLLSIPGNKQPSEQYVMIVSYRSPVGQVDSAVIDLKVQASDATPVPMTLPACTTTWCQVDTGTATPFNLGSFPILLSITVTTGEVLLDKLVAMPIEYTQTETLLSSPLPAGCNFLQNIMPPGEDEAAICKNALFTVTMRYWGSPLPCDCEVTGSVSRVCDANGGQCSCQNGIVGRKCDRCALDRYGLTSDGCTECNCDGVSSSCDAVTGQCQCPDNTLGRQCDLCLPGHWGWDRDLGCKVCGCNELGSAFPQCDDMTGICTCKPGVQGDKCDECKANFYNLGSQGCSPCSCDQSGSASPECNQTSGDCQCKSNTVGRQCNQCSPATFGLQVGNPGGCLNCVCMGVTTNCSSADIKIKMDLYPLVATTESGSEARLTLATADGSASETEVTIEANEQSYALKVSFDANASPLFWVMPSVLTSNLLDLYSSEVSVDVMAIVTGGEPINNLQAVILTTDGSRLTTSFGTVSNGFTSEIIMNLRESQWVQDGVTTELSREQFLKALSKASHFLIPTTFSSAVNTASITSLKFGIVGDTGVDVKTVEECVCGEAYSGRSCQRCADGYKRDSQDSAAFFGSCVPCECNGHSSACNEETGACISCQHNTVGPTCEQCADGFHGNATIGTENDCLICPCISPRVEKTSCTVNASANNEISCSFCNEGYEGNICDQCSRSFYGNPQAEGGTCLKCECNNNAEICDSITGVCIDCQSNTVGNNCERCAENFYGNASSSNCAECGCVESASISVTCDATSGQCPCHPGVGGRTCDQCLEGFWGYSNAEFVGCNKCQCLLEGSEQIQCDTSTGQCTCKPNTEGASCDSCSVNFFGLPEKPCEACACDATGTVLETTCESLSGNCTCQPGVTGRTCDQCLPLYIEFSAQGCVECGSCQSTLGDSMKTLSDSASLYLQNTKTVFDVQDQDSRLQVLEKGLQSSLEQLGISGTDATSINDVTGNITSQLTILSSNFQSTNNKLTSLQTDTGNLLTGSRDKADAQTTMNANATLLVSQLTTLGREVTSHLQFLTQYNESASELSEKGDQVTSVTLNLTEQTLTVNKLLSDVQDTAGVDAIIETIKQQEPASSNQIGTIAGLMQDFSVISVEVDDLISNHSKVAFRVAVVDNNLDKAIAYKSQAEELLVAFNSIVAGTEASNLKLGSTFNMAVTAFQNARSVYAGDATSVINGEDVMPFPSGVTNYENGRGNLNNLLLSISGLVTNTEEAVTNSESHLANLQTGFDALNNTYLELPAIGKEAKAAIDNYKKVILDLNNAVTMANSATELIAQVQADILGDSLEQRRVEYDLQKNMSVSLRDEIQSLDLQPQVLEVAIQSAQDKIIKESDDWANLDLKLANMTSDAGALSQQFQGNSLMQSMSIAVGNVVTAKGNTETIISSIQSQGQLLTQKEGELNKTQEQIQETKTLDVEVRNKLNIHLTDFAAFETKVTAGQEQTTVFQATSSSIQDKIDVLEEKLAEAENLLSQLRQPMTFDSNLNIQIDNPHVNTPHIHDHVSLNVKKAAGFTDGNIFFTENDQSDEEFEIGLADSHVFLEFHTGSDTVRVTNPTELCNDCWSAIEASRIGNVGYVSVTNIATGEITSYDSSAPQVSTSVSVTLTTPLYIGTLPQDTTITKVTNKEFQGCLNDVQYQSQAINLWAAAVSTNQQAGCCQAPPSSPQPPTTSGTSFEGLGFILLRPPDVASPVFESLSFQFRTFSPKGSLFLQTSADSQIKLSLSISEGAVSFEMVINELTNEVVSDGTYNTGQWVTVTASLNADQMELSVNLVGSTEPQVKMLGHNVPDISALSALGNQYIVIGAPSNPFKNDLPLEEGRTILLNNVNDDYYAGCIRNVDLDISSFGPAVRLNMNEAVIQSGVKPNECPENVDHGLNFLTSSSFIKLSDSTDVSQISSLEMKVITRKSQGIFAYVSASGTTRFMYVALFGGNVIAYYRQENTGTIISTGIFISDGQEHTIKIQTVTSRVSLQVDGSVFEESSATLSDQFLSFTAGAAFYLGGVPADTVLTNQPVSRSLIGGITSLNINGNAVTFLPSSFEMYKDISLEGIPRYLNVQPQTLDTCATKSIPSLSSLGDGAHFTGVRSYDWTERDELAPYFQAGFTLKINFASYKADGVLLYAADSLVTPNHYLTVYLFNGFLNVKMKTNLGVERTLTSNKKYNDALRHEVTMTRVNDFIQISIENGDDYVNNGVSSETASELVIPLNIGIYLGGLGNNELTVTPLPSALRSKAELPFFAGALYSASVDNDNPVQTFNVATLDRALFPAIPSDVTYGVSLNGQTSYLQLDQLTSSPNRDIIIAMTISSTTETALLLVLFETTTSRFISLDYSQNKIKLHLSPSFTGITGAMSQKAFTFSGTNVLCDGKAHSLQFHFSSNVLTTTVDTVTDSINIPISHAIQPLTDAAFFIGGITATEVATLPASSSTASLKGCVQKIAVTLNGIETEYDPTQFANSSSGLTYGCPN